MNTGIAAISILQNYYTPDELAKELGVAPRTLDRWISLGEAPDATMVGRKRLFHRDEIDKWLRARVKRA